METPTKSFEHTKRFSSQNSAKKLKIIEAIIAALTVLFVIFLIIIGLDSRNDAHQDERNSDTSQSSDQVSFVLKGNRGQLTYVAMACPELPDTKYFDNSYSQSEISQNFAGKKKAINTAIQEGCVILHPSAQGLVIDMQWFPIGYDRIRMDFDGIAYWVEQRAVVPISVQSNNVNQR